MSATKSQRIGIWVIVIFLAVGTVGSFAIIVLANQNAQSDQARISAMESKYQADQKDYQNKVAERNKPYLEADSLSDKYYNDFSKYQSRVAAFDKDAVTELETKDLKVGDGAEIDGMSEAVVYYIGWNPDGKVFDGSIEGKSLKKPFIVQPGGVIQGWSQGLDGMKVNGVREISIPSNLAYGETGSGENIPPNTPIKFVVMVIAKLDAVEQPYPPEELINYYQTGRLQ